MSSINRATLVALAATVLALTSAARAADDTYVFKSVLSTPNASWCIEVSGGQYEAGRHVLIAACNGQPQQTFGYEDKPSLTIGGFCLDGLAAKSGQPPSAGDPVGLAECNGSDQQAWELPPFKGRAGVFAIANPDDLCVTVDSEGIRDGSALVLAKCAEVDRQGWVSGKVAAAPGAAPVPVAEEFYWYSGHRYCWYERGWHGPGWYWCGENFHRGIGWGGPIGWHRWHHRGHPPRVHVRRPPHVVRHPARLQRERVRLHKQPRRLQRVHKPTQRLHKVHKPRLQRKTTHRIQRTTTHRVQRTTTHRTQRTHVTKQPSRQIRRHR